MNNFRNAGKVQLIFTFIIICFVGLWVCSITIETLKQPILQWATGIFTIITFLFFSSGGFYYFEIKNTDDAIEVKFYNSFPFAREFKMYRIPIKLFIKYEISEQTIFRRKLRLYQMSSSQLAKFPPIYITAFSRTNLNELELFFKLILEKRKSL